jgi:ATP-dependent Clp protease, protease subunit
MNHIVHNKNIPSPFAIGSISSEAEAHPALSIQLSHLIEYFGIVNYATNERVLGTIKESLIRDPEAELTLLITSAGGPSGTAMSFYDSVRHILRPRLTTIGAGDVDSSGVLLFLSGTIRLVTPHTTMLLHPAGRHFENGKRFTAAELEATIAEDRIKDEQYAAIISGNSGGKLSIGDVLELMSAHTVLEPDQIVAYGLANDLLK